MIEPFYGELFLSITPLEFSGNKCSHNCAYCFANIQRDARYSEIEKTIGWLQKSKHTGLAGRFFDEGYSITISNRTDPFSETNYRDTLALGSILANRENGIFLQTKLGKKEYVDGFIDATRGKKNIIWYITVTTPNDEIAKIIEPGAPRPSERLEVAKWLKKQGYEVVVAFNPFVHGWTSVEENGKVTDDLVKAGITMFIYQNLHMRSVQVNTFSEYRKKQFEQVGTDLSRYTIRANAREEQKYMQGAVVNAIKKGYDAVAFGMPFRTDFFDKITKPLGKCTPSNYYFYNWVVDNKKPGDILTVEDYKAVMAPYFGVLYKEQFRDMPTYIMRQARQVWKGNDRIQNIKTFDELLEIVWEDKRISASPRNNQLLTVEGNAVKYVGGGTL